MSKTESPDPAQPSRAEVTALRGMTAPRCDRSIAEHAHELAMRVGRLSSNLLNARKKDNWPLERTNLIWDIGCSTDQVTGWLERKKTVAHAESFAKRVDNVLRLAEEFADALSAGRLNLSRDWRALVSIALREGSLRAPHKDIDQDGFALLIRLTAEQARVTSYVSHWAEDIAQQESARPADLGTLARPEGMDVCSRREETKRKARRRMPRAEADAKASAYIQMQGYPGNLRNLAKAIGCSHETARQCPSVKPHIKQRSRGAGPTPRVVDIGDLGVLPAETEDPLNKLVNEETIGEILAEASSEERDAIRNMVPEKQRELAEAYDAQQRAISEDRRPRYASRRRKP